MLSRTTAPATSLNSCAAHILRFPLAYFLCALVLMILGSPFVDKFWGGTLVEAALMTLVFLTAVLAVGGRLRTLVWAVVLVVPALVARWIDYWRSDLPSSEAFYGTGMLFVGFVVLHLLFFILRAPTVDSEVLCAGVANYLMLGFLWALAYSLVDRLLPNSFVFTVGPASDHAMRGFNALYFSCITLSTVGYGDVIPISGSARMLAMLEAMVGMFYVTLLIARLVSLYSSKAQNQQTETNNPK